MGANDGFNHLEEYLAQYPHVLSNDGKFVPYQCANDHRNQNPGGQILF